MEQAPRKWTPQATSPRRSILRGCLIALLAFVILLGATWLLVRNNLGTLASGYVRRAAAESLNGRLEFASLDIDLAGRAVMEDVRIIQTGIEEPVIVCPRASASLNFFTLLGPNRGMRTIVLTLHEPRATVVRKPDGGFNLSDLIKPREQQQDRRALALAINLRGANVDFTDHCLLAQTYPKFTKPSSGLGAKVFGELSYRLDKIPQGIAHSENMVVDGSVAYNSRREELALKLTAQRPAHGGSISLRGDSAADGSQFDLTVGLEQIDLGTLTPYLRQLFPGLGLHKAGADLPAELRLPSMSALIETATIDLERADAGRRKDEAQAAPESPRSRIDYSIDVTFEELRYASGYLPDLQFAPLRTEYDSKSQQANAELQLSALDASLVGKPRYNFSSGEMHGDLKLSSSNPAELATYLGLGIGKVSGQLTAEAKLAGTSKEPNIALSGKLAKFNSKDISLESLTADLKLQLRKAAEIHGSLNIGKLQAFGAETNSISADIDLAGSTASPSGSAKLKSDSINFGKLKLGALTGKVDYAGQVATLSDFKFKGGEVALKLSGDYHTKKKSGAFQVNAGPLEVAEALKLAQRFSPKSDFSKIDASGKLTAGAKVRISGGVADSALTLASDRMLIAGQLVENLKASGSLRAPNIIIDAAEGSVVITKDINFGGFTTDGPLRLAARVGGSISRDPKGNTALALTGRADTENLAPDQARISFKLAGPANDPEIRGQLKTEHPTNPLLLRVNGHYRKGLAPLDASLTWYATEVVYSGKADIPGKRLEGKLTADAVDLARFISGGKVSGVLSAEASISGNLDKPTIAGHLSMPSFAYALPERTYRAANLKAGFKVADAKVVSISDGSFTFEGNSFTAAGVLGRENSDINIDSANFNLFSALAFVRPSEQGAKSAGAPLPEIKSSGPLSLRVAGTLQQPTARLTYSSGPGIVEGHKFDAAQLTASLSKQRIEVENFNVQSSQGSARLQGAYSLESREFAGDANIQNFDIAVIAPLSGIKGLAGAEGLVNGTVRISGGANAYSADGSLTLTNGVLQGVEVERASADLSTAGKGVKVSNGVLIARDTELTFSGEIAPKFADSNLSAQAETMNLSVVNAFLPASVPRLGGVVGLDLKVSPSGGEYPDVTLSAADKGQGLRIGEYDFTDFDARARISRDTLSIEQFNLAAGASTLSASGTVGIGAMASGQRDKAILDLKAKSSDFRMADLGPFLPQGARGLLPEGRATADVAIGGSVGNPTLAGNAAFLVTAIPEIRPDSSDPSKFFKIEGFSGLAGNVKFTHLRSGTAFDFNDQLPPSYAQASTARVTGSGELRFPFEVTGGGINIAFSSGGQFTSLNMDSDVGSFNGLVGGQLVFEPDPTGNYKFLIGGSTYVNQQGKQSSYSIPQLKKSQESVSVKRDISFRNLEVIVNPGTRVSYEPMNMDAEVDGTVTLNGEPSREKLSVLGKGNIRSGEVRPLKLLKYTVKFQEPTFLEFKDKEDDEVPLMPYLTGSASLTLQNVLSEVDLASAGSNFTPIGDEDDEMRPRLDTDLTGSRGNRQKDLKIIFSWKDFPLNPEERSADLEATLSSVPPLPKERILSYLYGEISGLLTGETEIGDFAQEQAVGIGTGFLSKAIERGLGLTNFTIGGSGGMDNPYFVDVEKQIDPRLAMTYYRDFYSDSAQSSEIGLRYSILGGETGDRYSNLDLELNFIEDSMSGSGSEFMFKWSKKF